MKVSFHNMALLVIDCQCYFFDSSSPAYLKASSAIVPRINRLLEAAAAAGWPVVFTAHRAPSRPGNLMSERYQRLPTGRECGLWPGIIRPKKSHFIVKEHYSAFHRTGLERKLRSLGTTDILLCGVMTHLCVDTTARHGFMLGFRPHVVGNACCSKSPAHHRAGLLALRHGFADVQSVSEVIRHAQQQAS